MKRATMAVSGVVAAFSIVLSAQAPAELMSARLAFNDAATKADKITYAKFLVDDVTWVDRAGRLRDKATQTNELEPVTGTTTTTAIHPYRGGAVVVLTRGETGRILQVWVNRGSEWQLAAFQGTPIGEERVLPDGRPSSALPPKVRC